jgi:hypothetical protein
VDLGKNFYEAISSDERFATEFLTAHFPANADDDVWIPFVAERGWIAVTHDKKIRRQHRPMIARASAAILIVAGDHALDMQARNFIASFASIDRFIRKNRGPYTAKLHQPSLRDRETKVKPRGRVEMWGDWG